MQLKIYLSIKKEAISKLSFEIASSVISIKA